MSMWKQSEGGAERTAVPTLGAPIRAGRIYAPLTASLLYLGGTFALFIAIGEVALVPSLFDLVSFVLLTLVALTVGYVLKIRSYDREERLILVRTVNSREERRKTERLVVISAVYLAVYGLALLVAFGATGISDVIDSIIHPGLSYADKFQIFEAQKAEDTKNLLIQILTLLSVLYTPLVPLTIVYGKRLKRRVRVMAYLGVATYGISFLFIGTMKAFGDLFAFTLAGLGVLTFGLWPRNSRGGLSKRGVAATVTLLCVVFVGYMAINQSERMTIFGNEDLFEPNPIVAAVTGEDFARGIAAVAFYPTHGYLGLAYNLETPFAWSGGKGSSRALDSYWVQYLGAGSAFESTYPARTEVRTGWPALRVWATAYPWFASDLSFPGTIILMGLVGSFLARTWFEAAFERSQLALLLFCQFVLFIAYIPANNQIGSSRTSLIAFVSLVLLYATSRLRSRRLAQ